MINNIIVQTIESAIPASDCYNNYLLDWRNGIDYLVLED